VGLYDRDHPAGTARLGCGGRDGVLIQRGG
jgi:hypothetical protein